ncbi:OLC1v1014106C4 [Oldenlandia corymbosa var. corymbosa]|uniref:OLC1v1014106C4 n=1 Tax=Oldenlandia corymbosa var. corymbosa TaxID=529605 RepID=A0AAV1E219_OLDCO|nr:OLC1v1014106C4 [Oldenlandia corymbosa var. corymbosa]
MLAPSSSSSSSALKWVVQTPFHGFPHCPNCPSQQSPISSIKFPDKTRRTTPRFSILQTKASIDEKLPVLDPDVQEQPTSRQEVEESVRVLKNAAKTRKVPAKDILSAFAVIEKAKIDPSGFLETLGGTESPGRTWMLIFTAQKKLESGKYFPITAVQRFDAAGRRIENGVFLGPLGFLTFEGRFSWKKRILAFIFERIRIKIGPLSPFEFSFKGEDNREPSNKDPFFIWFYIDEEIAVARGRSGGTAFWVRCQRVGSS